MRAYNKEIDGYYSPDSTPTLYLTEEQVNTVLCKLPCINTPSEITVRETIRIIEKLNREEKLGSISGSDATKKIAEISNAFLHEYGFWPYITKTHEQFYKSFEE